MVGHVCAHFLETAKDAWFVLVAEKARNREAHRGAFFRAMRLPSLPAEETLGGDVRAHCFVMA
jgi:hypothetical protein